MASTPELLTPEEIAELRRLHEEATAAPWSWGDQGIIADPTGRNVEYVMWPANVPHEEKAVPADLMGACGARTERAAPANARMLTAARNALGRLLLAAERAEEMARALEEIAAMECSFGGFCDDKGHFGQPPDPLCAVCRARRARAAWRGSGAAEDGEGTP